MSLLLKSHASIPFTPEKFEGIRRNQTVAQSVPVRSDLALHSFLFLGSFVYNKANKLLNFYAMSRIELKKVVTDWLLTLDYNATENLIIPLK